MGDTLSIAGTISRSRLSLPDLSFHDPANGYVLLRDKSGPGAAAWRKTTVESPFVQGRFMVSAVRDQVQMPLGVRVTGVSHDQMDQRLATLIQAFEQFSYTLNVTIDGVPHEWNCEAADWAIADGSFNGLELFSHTQEITFTVFHFPLPVAGRY